MKQKSLRARSEILFGVPPAGGSTWFSKDLLGALTAVLVLVFAGTACNRPAPPPTPLTEAELPTAIEQAFAKAQPELKSLAGQVISSVQAKDYSQAFNAVQQLAANPALTKEQMRVASRAALTVNGLLQTAQTQGDAKAAQTLQNYRRDK